MNILQKIFYDYYEEMLYTLHPRKSVIENADKMLHCGDPSFGGAMYGCPHCGKLKFVPFRCHSRFCPTCGNKYSYDSKTVTFHYNRHEDNKLVVETIPAMDFIKRLIRHIPEKHFKMIRYGSLYARHRDVDKHLYRAISKNAHPFLRSFNKCRVAILGAFGYDSLKCPDCGHEMDFLELYFNHQRISLEEMYDSLTTNDCGFYHLYLLIHPTLFS